MSDFRAHTERRVSIDRAKRLAAEPHLGHNRYHPGIEPALEIGEGEELVLETRDALDGQIAPTDTGAVLDELEFGAIHPLTGPVYVKGAQPGDGLEIEFLDITTEAAGFTIVAPGIGFLGDVITDRLLVHWRIKEGWATSPQIPGVRIPGAPFMGISAVAPSMTELEQWTAREARLVERGGFALPPDPSGAVPADARGTSGLRTNPPRENGGNFDIKQLTRGAKLVLPVSVEGALFSTGDGHFAQGDGEVCVTAIEVGATVAVRFRVLKGAFAQRRFRAPVFSRNDYFADPHYAVPQRMLGVMGIPVDADGENRGGDVTLACRNAVLNMIELLTERGYSLEQAYAICSVAVDLRISNVVDAPNYVVSALLPEAIFDQA